MRAAITGCAGFIGSHLTERLLEDGASVLGVDAFSPTYDTMRRRQRISRLWNHRQFEFIEGDIANIDLKGLFETCDVVFHLAARPGVRASWEDFAQVSTSNVFGTQRVLQALAVTPGTRLVFASSSSVYGASTTIPTREDSPLSPISPYGVSKAAGETLISAYATQFGISAVSLRYFTVYGPRQRSDMAFSKWIRLALRGAPLPIYGDGTAVRDFTYVDDVVEATRLAAEIAPSGHETYNIAGGQPRSIAEVLEMLSELIGTAVETEKQSPARGDPSTTTADATKFRAETGWRPMWDLRDGLSKQVDWVSSPID